MFRISGLPGGRHISRDPISSSGSNSEEEKTESEGVSPLCHSVETLRAYGDFSAVPSEVTAHFVSNEISILDVLCNNNHAMEKDKYQILQDWLTSGEDPNFSCFDQRSAQMMTVLGWCVYQRDRQALGVLLKNEGVNPNIGENLHKTPLHIACQFGDLEAISLLLEHPQIKINVRDGQGNTPLHTACYHLEKEVVQLLLERGASAELKNEAQMTPTSLLVHFESPENKRIILEILQILNAHFGLSVLVSQGINAVLNAQDQECTSFFGALRSGNIELVQSLINQGYDPNTREHGIAALEIAIKAPNPLALITCLVNAGALLFKSEELEKIFQDEDIAEKEKIPEIRNFFHKKENKLTSIFSAVQGNNLKLIKKIVEEDHSFLKLIPADGHTFFHVACQVGAQDIVAWFLEVFPAFLLQKTTKSKIIINKKNGSWTTYPAGSTSLHIAVLAGQVQVARVLLRYAKSQGRDIISFADDLGNIPFTLVCRHGTLEMLQCFLQEVKIDLNARHPEQEQTFLESALAASDAEEKVKVLLRYGALPITHHLKKAIDLKNLTIIKEISEKLPLESLKFCEVYVNFLIKNENTSQKDCQKYQKIQQFLTKKMADYGEKKPKNHSRYHDKEILELFSKKAKVPKRPNNQGKQGSKKQVFADQKELKAPVVHLPPPKVSFQKTPKKTLEETFFKIVQTYNLYKMEAFLKEHPQFDLNIRHKNGKTALDFLVENKNPTHLQRYQALLRCLKNHGADFDLKNKAGQTLMERAHFSGNKFFLEAFSAVPKVSKAKKQKTQNKPLRQESEETPEDRVILPVIKPKEEELIENISLFSAIETGDLSSVQALLSHDRSKANHLDEEGNLPLHLAIAQGKREIAFALIPLTYDLNVQNKAGKTCLELAVLMEERGLVSALLGNPQNTMILLSQKNDQGLNPLHLAVLKEDEETIEILLKSSPHLGYSQTQSGENAFLLALREQKETSLKALMLFSDRFPRYLIFDLIQENFSVECLALLIEKNPEMQEVRREDRTPFEFALEEGFELHAEKLLELGAKPSGNALHLASEKGCTALLQRLIPHFSIQKIISPESYVFLNTPDAFGNAPVHYAAKNGHTFVIRTLVEMRGEVNLRNSSGNTALHEAALYNQAQAVEVLLTIGGNINLPNREGFTALHLAAQNNCSDVVSALFGSKGLSIDPQEHTMGKTPLHLASEFGYSDVVELLVDGNACINLQDYDQKTPLHYAYTEKHQEIINILIEHQADVSLGDQQGYPPLFG